jgi:hypothetical protein
MNIADELDLILFSGFVIAHHLFWGRDSVRDPGYTGGQPFSRAIVPISPRMVRLKHIP